VLVQGESVGKKNGGMTCKESVGSLSVNHGVAEKKSLHADGHQGEGR